MAKQGLGKGLGSLVGQTYDEVSASPDATLPIKEIHRNPNQPRTEFDQQALDELADSIKQNGVLQPILVRKQDKDYEIVAGERRYQAAKIAGLKEVPVLIREITDEEVLKLALIENLQRADLNPIEEARSFKVLIDEQDLTQEELAKMLSKSRSSIANSLRLLDLSDDIQRLVIQGKISAGHARAVVAIPNDSDRMRLTEKIIKEGLSVRETERLVPLYVEGKKEPPKRVAAPASYKKAARKLRRVLNTKVRVKQAGGKNTIEIEFIDEEDLARLLDRISERKD